MAPALDVQCAKEAAQAFHDGAVAYFGEKHSVVASGLHNLALVHKVCDAVRPRAPACVRARMYARVCVCACRSWVRWSPPLSTTSVPV